LCVDGGKNTPDPGEFQPPWPQGGNAARLSAMAVEVFCGVPDGDDCGMGRVMVFDLTLSVLAPILIFQFQAEVSISRYLQPCWRLPSISFQWLR